MSMCPVYVWNPANFPDPQAMLPESFEAAQEIVDKWGEQPLPQGADISAFTELAEYIAEVAKKDYTSKGFKKYYQDIETWLPESLKTYAVAELSEYYSETMPILDHYSRILGLVLYDSNGKIILPDGREFPDDDFFEDFFHHYQMEREAEQQRQAEGKRLPGNINAFTQYFRTKLDPLMEKYGYQYAPQFFAPDSPEWQVQSWDGMIYAKPTEHGWQTISVYYRDPYNDGEYDELNAFWALSDEVVERIYLYETDHIPGYLKRYNEKDLIPNGNIECFWKDAWNAFRSKTHKTETGIEEFLDYLERQLKKVAHIYSYDDVEAYFEKHMIDADQPNPDKAEGYRAWVLPLRLVIAYLSGRQNLAELIDEWLFRKNYYPKDKSTTEEDLKKTLHELQNRYL